MILSSSFYFIGVFVLIFIVKIIICVFGLKFGLFHTRVGVGGYPPNSKAPYAGTVHKHESLLNHY